MMNTHMPNSRIATAALVLLLLAACAAAPKPDGATAVRAKLTQLQSDPQLAGRAPVALKDAEFAVREAETPTRNVELGRHRVAMADRKVEIARAEAQSRFAEDQQKALAGQRETARLDARTREADAARSDAKAARSEADKAREDAAYAERDTAYAEEHAADLQQQIRELNAKATDRGLVVTLGDVLFSSGASDLKGGTPGNLNKLAAFLNKYPDRTVVIEGHTDSVGSADSNLGLSQRRADSVKSYLVGQGVASVRVTASGKGEGSPAAGNESVTGRQQNRRVEVIISNTVTSSR